MAEKLSVNVFISQPMRNRTADEINEEREIVIEWVHRLYDDVYNVNVLDTYFKNEFVPDEINRCYYLGKSIMVLAEANVAVFVDGWEEMRGCVIEHDVCKQYEIPVIYYNK